MSKKSQILFFVAMGLIFVVFVIYFAVSISGTKKKDNNVVPNDVEVFNRDTTNKLYSSKVEAYNDLDKEREKEKVKEGVNVDLGKYFNSKNISSENEEVKEQTAKPEPKKQVVSSPSTRPVRERVFKPTVEVQPEPKSNNTEVVKNEPTSGFGIYSAKKKTSQKIQETKAVQNNFFPAYFEEDTKIKNGSPVVLVLRSDASIEGVSFHKNATMYGYVSDAGDYFDIRISSIKNTDGNSYHVSNVVVYNEKYSRGIAHEGKLDNSVKESSDETANDVASNLPISNSVGQTGVNLATKTVSNTVRNLTRKRQPEISIMQGYKIFVKSE